MITANKKEIKEKNRGITLISLVITIIVLLIFTSVSIAMLTGENGMLTRTGDAKIETVLGAVREQVHLYQIEKKMNEQEVTAESLLAEGKVSRTVQAGEADKYYMYYALKENSFKGMQGLGKGNIASRKDIFLIDDNLNIKYISSNGKEYGDTLNNKVLDDETEIRFSSKAFSEYVSKISGVAEEAMKFRWMKNQTSLTITDTNVDSLQDLVFFPNLTSLTLGEYGTNIPSITSMNGIENCTKLTRLNIIYGPDKDYSAVTKLSNLTTFIRFSGTDYENIIEALAYCKTIRNIEIRNQIISDMSKVSKLNNLETLDLSLNNINKIDGLKNMTDLKYLNLSDNKITEIVNLENLKNLEELDLSNNNIEDITPLIANSSLITLNLKGNANIDGNRSNYTGEKLEALNKIGKILDREGNIYLDLDKLGLFTNYKNLDLSRQNLTTLEALEGITQLKTLNLGNNKLTLEDKKSQEILKSMLYLENLNLMNNQITNIKEINNLRKLKFLYLSGENNNVDLKEIEDIISNLDILTISNESLKTITNCDANKITRLNFQYPYVTELPDLSKFTKLNSLGLSENTAIKNMNIISKINNLKSLNLMSCNMHNKMINFSNLNNLISLNLSYNTLWSEDLENLKVLKNNTDLSIDLSNNSIIDASALLELNSNTKIDLRNNVNLAQDSKNKLKAKFGNNVQF